MRRVPSRDLRNHTAGVLRQVAAGEVVAVTVHGRVVAEVHPPQDQRPTSWSREEFIRRVLPHQADADLREVLHELDQSSDELSDPWS